MDFEIRKGRYGLIAIHGDVLSWADRGAPIAIRVMHHSISLFPGFLPRALCNGARVDLFTPVKTNRGYRLIGFGFRLLPSLAGAVVRWPRWYQRLWRAASWRNSCVDGRLKTKLGFGIAQWEAGQIRGSK